MRHLVAQRWSRRTAIVAALMMCVQLLAGSFLLGTAAAAPPMIDAYGNPLCITSAHGPADKDGKDHSGLPDCCAPGCMMFAPVKGTDREPLVLSNPLAASVRTTIVRLFVLDARPVEHDPGHPRAPPFPWLTAAAPTARPPLSDNARSDDRAHEELSNVAQFPYGRASGCIIL